MSVWLNGSRLTPQSPAGWPWAIGPRTDVAARDPTRAQARTNRKRHILQPSLAFGSASCPSCHAVRVSRIREAESGPDASEQRAQVLAPHLDAELADDPRMRL